MDGKPESKISHLWLQLETQPGSVQPGNCLWLSDFLHYDLACFQRLFNSPGSTLGMLCGYMRAIYAVLLAIVFLSINQLVHANDTIFIHAVKNDDTDLIGYLAQTQENINLSDSSGKTALMVAAKAGENELVRLLLDKGAQADLTNNNGGSAIMFACIKGDIITVKLLLASGVDINARGSNGWGALMIASAKGHADVVRLLLDDDVDVNTVDVYDWAPLHRASFENHEQVVKLLLSVADLHLDARNDQGATALHHAAIQGNHEISRLLISQGASVQAADLGGRTPVNYAQKNGFNDLAALLNSATNDIN